MIQLCSAIFGIRKGEKKDSKMKKEKPCNLQDFFEQEFAFWRSTCRVSKKQKGDMPQELPTSLSVTMPPQPNLMPAHQGTAGVSTVNSVVIQKQAVLSSMCETVRSQAATKTTISQPAKKIDLVVVPNTVQERTTTVPQIGETTTTTQSNCEYKLSEIVSREKDILFQTDRDPDLELEPARENVFSVRRRSRQFFTVMEEDENGADDKYSRAELVAGDTTKKEKTAEVDPIFNLGDSLRKLYFPDQHKKKRPKRRKEHGLRINKKGGVRNHGYESDPEGKIELCKIISEDPEFKQYKSHPELSGIEGSMSAVDENFFESHKSKSLPATPRVSPKLKRRNSSKKENDGEVKKNGPGFSFLESVAGQLYIKKKQHEKKLEKGLVRVSEGQVVVSRPVEVQVVAQQPAETAVSQSEPTTNMHTHHVHDFSDSAGSDLESSSPAFMKSFFSWSATQKVNVSNKESNMFSPTSF